MELPVIRIAEVFHVGTLEGTPAPRSSLEGSALSVSCHPEEWRQIAQLGAAPTWRLTRPDGRFVDACAVGDNQRRQIEDWAVEWGLATVAHLWEVTYWDDEFEEERAIWSASLAEAEEEADWYGGTITGPARQIEGTARLARRHNWPGEKVDAASAFDLALLTYAEDETGFDGVWWTETLDPDRLSAPRGGIVTRALPRWARELIG